MIIKSTFKCKYGSQTSKGLGHTWVDRFIVGKWYIGEYETWETKYTSEEEMCRINGGWKNYWVINESGVKEKLDRTWFRSIFHHDLQSIRDAKIDELLR